jgi:hypothetical protein
VAGWLCIQEEGRESLSVLERVPPEYIDQLRLMLKVWKFVGKRMLSRCGNWVRSAMLDAWLVPGDVIEPLFVNAYEVVFDEKKAATSLTRERAQRFVAQVLQAHPISADPDLISFWLWMFDSTDSAEIAWTDIQTLFQVRR